MKYSDFNFRNKSGTLAMYEGCSNETRSGLISEGVETVKDNTASYLDYSNVLICFTMYILLCVPNVYS
jgi:hypothetical protein